MSTWTVTIRESVLSDLRALGAKWVHTVLREAAARLSQQPLADTRHMKTLRPNDVAQRQLSLMGVYRVLFDVEKAERTVTIVLIGEKRGNALYVRGRRFTAHESGSAQ
jgi:mRNA-degrading endonuclease RelE of RelBE toxin-antitoxin system